MIDTTGLKPRQLQKRLQGIVSSEGVSIPLRIEVMSFGFKRGLPRQADLVLDVRFLPNPFYVDGLGNQTGLDEDVCRFVMEDAATQEFMQKMTDMLGFLIPHYQNEGKHRLMIGIGCTGGQHRSVAIAEAIAQVLRDMKYQVSASHRDLEIEQARWKNGTITEE